MNKKTVTNHSRKDTILSKKRKVGQKFRHKYIFVIGGVMSGVGKGVATSSIGTLLCARGFRINLVKVDPYLNVDAGTMNPTEHGEVFVLNSGLETDQDMGNYERFLGRDLSSDDYITSGMIYKHVNNPTHFCTLLVIDSHNTLKSLGPQVVPICS
jgi:hypothetical protein